MRCILLHRNVIHPGIRVKCRCLLRPRHRLVCLLRNRMVCLLRDRMVVIRLDWNECASGWVVDEMLIPGGNNLLWSWLLWWWRLLLWRLLLLWWRRMHLSKDISRWGLCCCGSCGSSRIRSRYRKAVAGSFSSHRHISLQFSRRRSVIVVDSSIGGISNGWNLLL